ncbi:putative Ig domain-containing protein [Rudanella lutea]|uniref:putative Ig domain-containing protein n=1 Tax=Rudanella lutea TaxID=451374 RepID=UPI000380D452|nr:putative Ig domain-containing protein [Rudanella lutea]
MSNHFHSLHLFFRCLILVLLLGSVGSVTAQSISGTVFQDFNSNGIYESIPTSGTYAYGEPGLSGVAVRAYNTAGVLSGSGVSGATGTYSFSTTGSGPFRVEFSIPGSLSSVNETAVNSTSLAAANSVQFTSPGSSTLNFGVLARADYCQSNPPLIVPCFVSGDALAPGVAAEHVIVSFPYSSSSSNTGTASAPNIVSNFDPTPRADAGQVGSVWGMAYQRETQKLFSAAFLKRHVGLGSGGLGGIYVTTPTGTAANGSLYVDLEAAPFNLNLGQTQLGTRSLPTSTTVSSTDPNAFTLVGKAGLGSMAISDDGSRLYITDLFNRQLLILNVGNPAKAAGSFTASDLTTVAIPTTVSCTNGLSRPFAVAVYRGKVYVGTVCTAESPGSTSANLSATVYAMDEATQTFSTTAVFNTPLTYPKGDVHAQFPAMGSTWEPWISNFSNFHFSQLGTTNVYRTARPQPMLSDIDFTDRGDMVLSLMDRSGHQLGYRQVSPVASTTLYSGYIGGDMLRARLQGSTWVLENNAIVTSATLGSTTGGGANNGQGPGNGEFFNHENFITDNNGDGTLEEIHQETSQGGAVIVPGTNNTVSINMDPLTTWSGGTIWHSNTNGAELRRYEIYRTINNNGVQVDGTYGKANGLGLPVALCDPAPIQIGNRVWKDTNDNGIQDPGEPALAGVTVRLSGPGLPTGGVSVTTNAAGEYYFSNATSSTNTTGFAYSLTGLTAGSSYSLTFPTSVSAGALLLSTKPNSATGTNPDLIDTDVAATGLIVFSLGQSGQNNFSFDAGYTSCAQEITSVTAICNPTTNLYTLTGTISLTNAPATSLTVSAAGASTVVSVSAGQSSVSFALSGSSLVSNGPASQTVTVVSSGSTCGLSSTTFAVPASCSVCSVSLVAATLATGTVGTPYSQTISATGGSGPYTYSVTAGTLPAGLSLSAGGILSGTPSTTGTSTFTVTATSAPNCSAVASYSVTVAPVPVCALNVTATPGACQTATNQYTLTGSLLLTNNTAGGIATVTDGIVSTTVTVPAQATAVSYTLSGFVSGSGSHTVTASLPGCGSATTTYAAPASCTVCPTLSLSATGLTSTTVGVAYSATLSTSGGQTPYSYSLIGGSLPVGLSLSADGTISGTPLSSGVYSTTIRVTDGRSCSDVLPFTLTVDAVPLCSLDLVVTPGNCNSAINEYSVTGTITAVNASGTQSLTVQEGNVSTVVTLTNNGPASFTLNGLMSDGGLHTITVFSSNTACGTVSQTYTAPASCTVAQPQLTLTKQASLSLAQVGDVVTYVIKVANTGPIAATNVVVDDILDSGIQYVPGSATASAGTYSASVTGGGTWTIASLPVGATATLSFSGSVLNEGVLYNTVRIPDLDLDAKVCTSVPIKVCQGAPFSIQLDAPAGYSRYQWYLTTPTGTTLVSDVVATTANAATANSYTATQAGEYRVIVDEGVVGSCPDQSCCPIIIEAVAVPQFTALTRNPTCISTTPQTNGQLSLTALNGDTRQFTYQYSSGSTFNAATATVAQTVPVNGIISSTLSAGIYTIRVFNSAGCFQDATVTLTANCDCKTDICTPLAIKKTRSLGKPVTP